MKKTLTVLAATAALLVTGAPSAQASTSTVRLTADMQAVAYHTQLFDCYYYQSGISPGRNDRAFTAFYRARCNPRDQLARSLSRSKQIKPFYDRGLRTGWCFRWLGNSPVGTPVSKTCVATVQHISHAGNVIG